MISAIFFIFFVFYLGILSYNANKKGPLENSVTLEISNATSLLSIAEKLDNKKVISNKYNFILLNYLLGTSHSLKAGEYYFEKGVSQKEIIDMLFENKVVMYSLTIPECFSNKQVFDKINTAEGLTGIIQNSFEEGVFFPDTYYYPKGTQKSVILKLMTNLARKKISNYYLEFGYFPFPLENLKEVVILASIVESEAKKKSEMRRIASVFLNRLKKGMRLQSDPTVIYGLVKSSVLGRQLTRKDLSNFHPWNTYQITGLPPTPICNVGDESIKAVFNAFETNEIYFVADGEGGHYFSKTLEEHNAYIKNIKKLNE